MFYRSSMNHIDISLLFFLVWTICFSIWMRLRAYLEELLEHNEIRRVDPQSESWNTTDFIVRRNRLWVRKTSEEQRKYVAKLVKDFHPIDIL